jgi:hypothetical protein
MKSSRTSIQNWNQSEAVCSICNCFWISVDGTFCIMRYVRITISSSVFTFCEPRVPEAPVSVASLASLPLPVPPTIFVNDSLTPPE